METTLLESQKTEEITPVKDSWFKGYLEGNTLLPQGPLGISAMTLASVLEDHSVNWDDFQHSQFSPEQISFIGSIMSRAHHSKGVTHATKEHASEKDSIVKPERFQELWEGPNY